MLGYEKEAGTLGGQAGHLDIILWVLGGQERVLSKAEDCGMIWFRK